MAVLYVMAQSTIQGMCYGLHIPPNPLTFPAALQKLHAEYVDT
ncbi:MAG: hypothetical protein P1S60_11160 [Anaerolineae bacterium]|nr:hypothetical protein [Anaerolineae bacterium]